MWHTKKFVSRLLLLVFRSQADSGEEINDILNPEFKLGAQSGLDGSNRAAGMPKIKWLPQTCSVELFSRSWDGVNLCDWFLITIHHASAQIIFVKFHLYSLCLVDKKPFFRSIATIFCTTSNSARRDHDFQFKENKFNKDSKQFLWILLLSDLLVCLSHWLLLSGLPVLSKNKSFYNGSMQPLRNFLIFIYLFSSS